jgi:3-deoxy-7-phosphoheptulonate synthase
MIESHLEEGRQDLITGQPLRPGVSITDACIGWQQTEPLLQGLARAVRARG